MKLGFYHPSSWSNRALRDQAREEGRGAWETSEAELPQLIAAALAGTRFMFPHLGDAHILKPDPRWLDAALARQVLVHILTEELGVPRRVAAAVSLQNREALVRGRRVITTRCEEAPEFAAAILEAGRRARIELETPRG